MASSARRTFSLLAREACESSMTKAAKACTRPRIRSSQCICTRAQSSLHAASSTSIQPPPASSEGQSSFASSAIFETSQRSRRYAPRKIQGEPEGYGAKSLPRRASSSRDNTQGASQSEKRIESSGGNLLLSSRSRESTRSDRASYGNSDLSIQASALPSPPREPLDFSGLPSGKRPPQGMHPKKQVRWLRRQQEKLAPPTETKSDDRGVSLELVNHSILGTNQVVLKRPPKPAPLLARGVPAYDASKPRIRSKDQMEPWQIHKDAMKRKFPDGWKPARRLSPEALSGIRALHEKYPEDFTTQVLAQHFKLPAEAIRRILKSKWEPTAEEDEERRLRWDKRGETIWKNLVEKGVHAPKKWRSMGIGAGPRYAGQDRNLRRQLQEDESDIEFDHNVPFEYADKG